MDLSGSPHTVFSADAAKALNDILLDKTRSVLFVGEQANYRTLPLALGIARGSLNGVFATYYEKGGEAARLQDVVSVMQLLERRDSHPDVRHALEEFLTYLSGLGDTWQTLSDHIYAWKADARYLPRFFEEHPECPKDAVIWFESPWRQRREGPVSELLCEFIQSASEVQESSGGIVILGTSTNMAYSPEYKWDELVRHAEQRGYTHFDCGGSFVLRMYDYGYYHRSGSGMPVHNALRGSMILHAFVKPRSKPLSCFSCTCNLTSLSHQQSGTPVL
ncbi:hypothetical protein CPB85DRAFT_590239 [Mucidula mucida]|nr:hypothetical protein CPB85DRAFT_590239 [Mucidula mucida]